jgi:hypothetical protein
MKRGRGQHIIEREEKEPDWERVGVRSGWMRFAGANHTRPKLNASTSTALLIENIPTQLKHRTLANPYQNKGE